MDERVKPEHPTQRSTGPSQHGEQRAISELPRDRLTALPLELIHEICSYFCPHCLSNDDFTPDIYRPETERATTDENWVSDMDAIPGEESAVPDEEDAMPDEENAQAR
jgi:hypothetical protein